MFDDLLLLQKGGNVVFFGELGKDSAKLIDYFESRGAEPIKFGENPAAWMLSVFSGPTANEAVNWAGVFKTSPQYEESLKQIAAIESTVDESKKISYDEIYVTTFNQRLQLMIQRLYRIYKRSPAYNLARLMIAVFYSFIIGSVFLRRGGRRETWAEHEVSAVLSTMFFSLIVIGTLWVDVRIGFECIRYKKLKEVPMELTL
jgi:ATP-binding cassette subfamily G (WHITE) protein 2 (SNQ2)